MVEIAAANHVGCNLQCLCNLCGILNKQLPIIDEQTASYWIYGCEKAQYESGFIMQGGAEMYLGSALLNMLFRNAVWAFERRMV